MALATPASRLVVACLVGRNRVIYRDERRLENDAVDLGQIQLNRVI